MLQTPQNKLAPLPAPKNTFDIHPISNFRSKNVINSLDCTATKNNTFESQNGRFNLD